MNIIQLYQDYNIDYLTEGHKHCSIGWVNTPCPFCTGNPGYHLGVPINGGVFSCRRCGLHPPVKTLSKLLNISEHEARKLFIQYVGISVAKSVQVKIKKKKHKLPSNTGPLTEAHKRYLRNRGFDPEYLEEKWGLLGTGIFSKLDGLDYSRRVLAPFIWDEEEVTFQARDITGKHALKYLACPKAREEIHHKHILYGNQAAWGDLGICVEGITDVWRFGDASFATLGIKYTPVQMRLIAKTFKVVAVCFDDEPQAIAQAEDLIADLQFRGLTAWRVPIVGDPGGMNQKDADKLVKQILKTKL